LISLFDSQFCRIAGFFKGEYADDHSGINSLHLALDLFHIASNFGTRYFVHRASVAIQKLSSSVLDSLSTAINRSFDIQVFASLWVISMRVPA
jgi:hypothetical protein